MNQTMNPWRLTNSQAHLQTDTLLARIDLANPALGLHDLTWMKSHLPGNLLGVTIAQQSASPTELSIEGIERFVRGDDLVANYPQNESQPFTLHIYWRIAAVDHGLVILDAIVSLQTSLLECFPKVILTTNLPAEEAWLIPRKGLAAAPIESTGESSESQGVLLRGPNRPWSYLEMTHPVDLGRWHVEPGSQIKIQRELGGEFQEKGVIRRLRVRGAFLPVENDLEVAARMIEQFADAPPPLTA